MISISGVEEDEKQFVVPPKLNLPDDISPVKLLLCYYWYIYYIYEMDAELPQYSTCKTISPNIEHILFVNLMT